LLRFPETGGHACLAMESVNFSMHQDPPEGSTGTVNLHSSFKIIWILRAMRREKSSAGRIA